MNGNCLSPRPEPRPPVTHRLRRNPEPLSDPPIPLARQATPRRSPRPRPGAAPGTRSAATHASPRHACSRQRPRRGRSRRSPSRVRSTRNRAQPQPPNTPTRQRGHDNRPAARSASTTARSSATINMTSSNGVTAPSSPPHQGLGEGASINRITTILSSRRPTATTHHHPA